MRNIKKRLMIFPALLLLFAAGSTPAADFDGDSRADAAIYRGTSGLWAVPGITRFYFGGSGDAIAPGDYNGDGKDDAAIYRANSGLWAVRNVTRTYLGTSGDLPVVGGGGLKTYDYVVKAGDADDLVRALESDTYRSVFIPPGDYDVDETINVDHVRLISGGDVLDTKILFDDGSGNYLNIEVSYCHIERITVYDGGSADQGNFNIAANYVTARECRSEFSDYAGFRYGAAYVSLIDCIADNAGTEGFRGDSIERRSARIVNCAARRCTETAFYFCYNLSNCYIDGYSLTGSGFYYCRNVTSSVAVNCRINGFVGCGRLSACEVIGNGVTEDGFHQCNHLSSCNVEGVTDDEYYNCTYRDPDSCS